ncbi:DUF11 domain-containing protein [Streptomyces antimicrobicus]|uniref:DUF11 domain-containing protein n=1 Tax=Streptomyces antimicrobicus TaxID=2883108 RepID=A0ABS8B3W1_9ACTN|nr:DUF11 domain-containing protein [Streptomyces antimicrobicus]MCB5179271.1 DUF11 domain-containing protein [Streptomyces antimicrobicus]
MRRTTRPRWLLRASVAGGTACGLALGLSTPASSAQLISLQLDAPDITISFRDTEVRDAGHTAVLTPQGGGGEIRRVQVAGQVPGVNRTVVRTVNAGLRPGTGYCAVIETKVAAEEGVFGRFGTTETSNQVCAEPTGSSKAATDVSITNIEGEANPPAGTNRNYWIHFTNSGADATGVTVDVQVSGSLTMRRLPESGTFSGMQCTASGSGFRCTGGTVAKGAKGQVPLLATVKSQGPGAVHASISAEGDTVPGNNSQALGVIAVPR